jgi:hypothetical protein
MLLAHLIVTDPATRRNLQPPFHGVKSILIPHFKALYMISRQNNIVSYTTIRKWLEQTPC